MGTKAFTPSGPLIHAMLTHGNRTTCGGHSIHCRCGRAPCSSPAWKAPSPLRDA